MCTPLELMFVSFPSDAELSIQILFNFSLIKICQYEYKNWTAVGMCCGTETTALEQCHSLTA